MNPNKMFDPKWQEISASLRKDFLYVKMPVTKASELVEALRACGGDLGTKEMSVVGQEGNSIVIRGTIGDWTADMEIAGLTEKSPDIFKEFVGAVLMGLDGDEGVDWIVRLQGIALESSQLEINNV